MRSAAGVSLQRTGGTLSAGAARTIARRLKVATLPRTSFATIAAGASFTAPGTPTPQPGAPADGPCRTTTAGGAPPAPGTGEPPVKAAPRRRAHGHRRDDHLARARVVHPVHRVRRGHLGLPRRRPRRRRRADPPLVYSFHFPFADGWCDPATGAARITFTGTVAFRYADHEIDLRVNDPEVELDGPASRVIFRMTGSGDTDGGNRRAVVETLDVSKAAAVRVNGNDLRLRADPRRGPARARPARSSPATTSRAIRSGGSRSPSPRPERTHAHAHPRPRRRGPVGRRAGGLRGGLHGHRRQARLDDGQPVRGRRRRGAHVARLRHQHRAGRGPPANGQGRADRARHRDRPDRRRRDGDRRHARRAASTSSSRSATRSRPRAAPTPTRASAASSSTARSRSPSTASRSRS